MQQVRFIMRPAWKKWEVFDRKYQCIVYLVDRKSDAQKLTDDLNGGKIVYRGDSDDVN